MSTNESNVRSRKQTCIQTVLGIDVEKAQKQKQKQKRNEDEQERERSTSTHVTRDTVVVDERSVAGYDLEAVVACVDIAERKECKRGNGVQR